MALLPPTLTLEDLPDDLLRICLRPPVPLTLRDVFAVQMLNRRLRAIAQEPGLALGELEVVLTFPHRDLQREGFTYEFDPVLDLHHRLEGLCTLVVYANEASLDWLCDDFLQRFPAPGRGVSVHLETADGFDPQVTLPATWRRLSRLLSPTSARLFNDDEIYNDAIEPHFDDQYWDLIDAATTWLDCCERLTSLEVYFLVDDLHFLSGLTRLTRLDAGLHYIVDQYHVAIYAEDNLENVMSLTGLQELNIFSTGDNNCGILSPDSCAPLAALSSLTALTLPLAYWADSFGPLPPALKSLALQLRPLKSNICLQVLLEEDDRRIPYEPAQPLPLALACPHLLDDEAGAAASLPRLDITFTIGRAGIVYTRASEWCAQYALHLTLAADSIPCAFSALEEFSFKLQEEKNGVGPHVADLVALLEAAPGLRHVRLEGMHSLTFNTILWLEEHRPGFRFSGGAKNILLTLPLE
jgi:hypothetical protein